MSVSKELLELAATHRSDLYISYASATGNAMSIAKRLHSSLKLATPLEPLNKYTTPEAQDEDKNTMANVSEMSFEDLYKYKGGISLNGHPIHFILVVISTTGNGDIPENGDRFFRRLKRLSRRTNYLQLRSLAFATLALGDTNYSEFCGAGKKLRSLFIEMGAKEMIPIAMADDATGMEEVVETWLIDTISRLQEDESIQSTSTQTRKGEVNEGSISYSQFIGDSSSFSLIPTSERALGWDIQFISKYFSKTFDSDQFLTMDWVNVKNVKCLTSSTATKRVLHFEVDISGKKQFQSYTPGDAIGIFPENSDDDVQRLFELLKLSPNAQKLVLTPEDGNNLLEHIPFPNDIFTIFKYYVDITDILTVSQLSSLARCCTDEGERRILSSWVVPTNINQYRIQIHNTRTGILDLLEIFTSCRPTLITLLQILSPQKPRYYSISSSPNLYPNEIHFAFNVVEYDLPNQKKRKIGLCTSFLARLEEELKHSTKQIRIPMFMRSTPEFRLPEGKDADCPIIMVGPGSGVTPFRSFIQHRSTKTNSLQSQASRNWLLHGCQKTTTDFLYQDEFKKLEENKNLTLLVASSQESEHGWIKSYFVQDIIYEYASDIVSLMEEQNGYMYMCGDAGKIFTHISNAVKYILHEELGITIQDAEAKIQQWKKMKRFQVDAW